MEEDEYFDENLGLVYPKEDTMATWNQQIENRNFLSPIGFKLLLAKYPKVVYFAQSANIPA